MGRRDATLIVVHHGRVGVAHPRVLARGAVIRARRFGVHQGYAGHGAVVLNRRVVDVPDLDVHGNAAAGASYGGTCVRCPTGRGQDPPEHEPLGSV